jgi:ATP-dependent DNA helicase RecQ
LELTGVVRPLGSFYSSYQFRFLQPEARILSGHKPERQAFLKRVFSAGKRGTKWITLNPDDAAEQIEEPRERIMKALTWMQEAGEIELKPSKARQRYRLCDNSAERDPGPISVQMQQLFINREARDVERLHQVLELAGHRGCLTRWLLRYFGEEMIEDCGTCTSCLERTKGGADETPRLLPQSPIPEISMEDVAAIRALIDERHVSLRTPRQLARFLCGLSSPATIRERLNRHEAYGRLEKVPFADVLAQTETMR